MREDISLQDYRDFGENLGKYSVGSENVNVYTISGALAGTLSYPIPDFSVASTLGYATLVSPSYVVGVRHNGGYKSVTFGNGAKYSATYQLISRNDMSELDFHAPRLSKVVTDTSTIPYVTEAELKDTSRYTQFARVGTGLQNKVDPITQEAVWVASAYSWKTGGTFVNPLLYSPYTALIWTTYSPTDARVQPLDIAGLGGDSGSPVFVYDNIDKQWKLAAVTYGIYGSTTYGLKTYAHFIQDPYTQQIVAENTDPDVTDSSAEGAIHWGATHITQGVNSWGWHGVNTLLPSDATNDELDASKDLRFNGDGGTLVLDQPVNLGAGKLQFSSDYLVQSAAGANSTWVGGGIEVDSGKTVQWQVNGLAGDALHKIGAGTLYVNATGINGGSLNTGDGTVVLDQQADADGNKQAFSSVTLVSGRPTVVLNDAAQVATDNIFFGYRGGKLDLNGNNLSFKKINHTDSGATLVNHNSEKASILTLAGYGEEDVSFHSWSSTGKGTIGDVYKYGNPYSKQAEYFQLITSNYGGYPTNQTSNSNWSYLGTDRDVAANIVLSQLNQTVFRGFLGDSASEGTLNVKVDAAGTAALTALTGGMNLNGNLTVSQGTLLLSGQPVPHAGGVVIDDDWATTRFSASRISASKGSTLQVGEYAQVEADIIAEDTSHVMLGYNSSASDAEKIWRCYSVINTDTTNCSQPVRTATELATLAASSVSGDISLGDNASLYLGRVNYDGAISSAATSTMTMDSGAYWQLTGNSRVGALKAQSGSLISLLAAEGTTWSPTQFTLDSLDATGLSISLAASPASEQGDNVTIRNSATGSNNTLDISVLTGADESVQLLNDIVLLDAPAGTAHDYFKVPSVARGFSLYTPNYQVIETDDRVQWVLAHNAVAEPSVPDEPSTPVDPQTPAEPEVPAIPETPAESKTPAAPASPEEAAESETPADPTSGKPFGWFIIEDNKPLIRDTRALLASRQYVFSEAMSQVHGRASLLRNSPEKNGEWVSIEQNKGSFEGFRVNQQSLNLGWDTVQGQQMFGLNAGYTQGTTKGNGQEIHHLASVGADYSWSSPAGWFVDAAARYMHLSQDLTFDSVLGIHHGKANSHILAGSVKSGYQFTADRGSLFISPYVGLSGGYLSGFGLKSNSAQVDLSASTPYFATAGLEVKKRGLWRSNPDVMLTAGIEYQYSPGKAGSSLTLSDSQFRRDFGALSDNRYRVHVGAEGKIADKWSLEVKARSSYGGTFRTDYSGVAGINYHF